MQNENKLIKPRIMVIGPSDTGSKGGMATVIKGIRDDEVLNNKYYIKIHPSYIDGNIVVRLLYSIYAYIKFLLTYRKYDLFHLHTASFGSTFRKRYYMKVIKRLHKKAIIHIHGAEYISFYEELNDKKKKKVREFFNYSDLTLALSQDWKDKLVYTIGIDHCEVLNNGIDVKRFSKAKCDIDKKGKNFLLLGRLCQRKGVFDLIEAIRIVSMSNPYIKVFLAGDGDIEKVKEEIKSKKLQNLIEVVGWVDDEKKISLLKEVSTIVLPSYNEGLPMAILEGMAAGKVIISTKVGAIPEVITPENGFLINPGDVNALAEAMVRCCTDVDMMKNISIANEEKVEQKYSQRMIHKQLEEYYDRILQ